MDTATLRKKSIDELKQLLNDLLTEQFNLRMQKGVGSTTRPHEFSVVRRNIACVKTILREKVEDNE